MNGSGEKNERKMKVMNFIEILVEKILLFLKPFDLDQTFINQKVFVLKSF